MAKVRILAVVPARGGSKGLPGKNVRPLLGKPLIAWTLDCAAASRHIDRIIVSTDDDDIARAAEAAGHPPPFRRPGVLAGDKASVVDAVIHAIETLGETWDYVVLLQPTSPLRLPEDIDQVIEKCIAEDAPAVVSVSPLPKPQNFICTVDDAGRLTRFEKDLGGEMMMLNGAVYIIRTADLLKERKFTPDGTLAFVMPFERSWDIDTLYDFLACEALAPKILVHDASVLGAVRR